MEADVVVVGAGFSGVACAERLAARGLCVVLLEAADRIGGRTHTTQHNGFAVDLGGMWIGPTQPTMCQLVKEYQIPTLPQYIQGKKVIHTGKELRAFSGTIPNLSIPALVELQVLLWRCNYLAKSVPVEDPWLCPHAAQYDAISVTGWIDQHVWGSTARATLELAVRSVFGAEPCDISLLYFLFYINAAGGFEQLIETKGCANEWRFVNGTADLLRAMIARFEAHQPGPPVHANAKGKGGERRNRIVLSAPVTAIEQRRADGGEWPAEVKLTQAEQAHLLPTAQWADPTSPSATTRIRVRTPQLDVTCSYVVCALPPSRQRSIEFSPPLPLVKQHIVQRAVMPCYAKCLVFYDRPFWRAAGYSGEASCYRPTIDCPVDFVFDCCNENGGNPALAAFVSGDLAAHFTHLSEAKQEDAVVRSLVRFFGDAAAKPTHVHIRNWTLDLYTGGCPVNVYAAGTFGRYAKTLREPFLGVHWAGTEAATVWPGYMEGAVTSGYRAADEIINRVDKRAPRKAAGSLDAFVDVHTLKRSGSALWLYVAVLAAVVAVYCQLFCR